MARTPKPKHSAYVEEDLRQIREGARADGEEWGEFSPHASSDWDEFSKALKEHLRERLAQSWTHATDIEKKAFVSAFAAGAREKAGY